MSDVEPIKAGLSASISHSDKYDKSSKTRWSPTPKPINEPENPCERKKLETKIASGLKKVYAVCTCKNSPY